VAAAPIAGRESRNECAMDDAGDAPTPRFVLDTNVFVAAAFRRDSASAALVERARAGELIVVWNEATRREAEAVLRRIPRLSWDEVCSLFGEAGRFGGRTDPQRFSTVPDPSDRKFAALAAAAQATLVSADADLLHGRPHAGFEVLKASEALRRLSR
jgi:predicted nucleic acid-binding protein